MTGMDVEELIARHPRVYHTMSATAWPSVRRHGLLSTRRLVDLFGLDAIERDRLLGAPRKQSTVLRAPGLPPAVIRDQKPMKFVAEKIDPDSSLTEYLDAINARVFFWASPHEIVSRSSSDNRSDGRGRRARASSGNASGERTSGMSTRSSLTGRSVRSRRRSVL